MTAKPVISRVLEVQLVKSKSRTIQR